MARLRLRLSRPPPPRGCSLQRYRNYCTTTVSCDSLHRRHDIYTVVTSSPSVVREWLYKTRRYHTHRLRRSCFLVGVGVQWKPSFAPGCQNSPATLQLCVGHRCLIFQLSHAPRVPLSLRRFLNDPNVTLVGINNKRDGRLLRDYSEHNLSIGKLIDLVDVGSETRNYSKVISMETLADLELDMTVRKDPEVGQSNWDVLWLRDDQIEYACVDAFVSFLVGKSLKAWRWDHRKDCFSGRAYFSICKTDGEDSEYGDGGGYDDYDDDWSESYY